MSWRLVGSACWLQKAFVTKNDHFLTLRPGGRLYIPVSDEKCMCVKKNDHYLKLCPGGRLYPSVSNENGSFSHVTFLHNIFWIKGGRLGPRVRHKKFFGSEEFC